MGNGARFGLLVLVTSCGSALAPPEPPAPPEPARSAAPPEPVVAPSASASAAPLPSASDAAPEPPPPPEPTVAETCEKLCVRADQICDAEGARHCRGACVAYVKKATGCEAQTRTALECQMKADTADLCAQIASSNCSREFRALQACQRGEAPPEAPVSTVGEVPETWQKVADEELGFTLSLPPGAARDAASQRRTWRAEEGGVSYVVASLAAPPDRLSDQALLRMVIDYVGFRCQRDIRLHGRFESEGVTGVRYDTRCNDKSEWHGMLRIRGGKALSIGWHAPAGVQGVLDPFFFSFEYQKP